jgi:hypothetical protein
MCVLLKICNYDINIDMNNEVKRDTLRRKKICHHYNNHLLADFTTPTPKLMTIAIHGYQRNASYTVDESDVRQISGSVSASILS